MCVKKSNYSFRLTDETVNLIDGQNGSTRTEKFENLVYSRFTQISELEENISVLKNEVQKHSSMLDNLKKIESYINWCMSYAKKGKNEDK